MAKQRSQNLSASKLDELRKKAQESRKKYVGKPAKNEVLTEQEIEDSSPFYFVLVRFVKQLKAARLKAGLTLLEVSERSGIAVESLSRLETGAQTNPTWKTLANYALAVGVRPQLSVLPEIEVQTSKPKGMKSDAADLQMNSVKTSNAFQ